MGVSVRLKSEGLKGLAVMSLENLYSFDRNSLDQSAAVVGTDICAF